MAHRIVGVDLGAYSVKLAVVSAGFRKTSFVDWLELQVPAAIGDETLEARQARAIGQLLRQRGWDHDFPFTTLGGEALSMRVLDFPFQGLKRADLDKAVGAELENQLPHELDDMVYTYDQLPRDVAVAPAESSVEPTAAPPSGTRILAAATTKDRVSRLIATLAAEHAEPHGVVAAPAAYARVAGSLAALGGDPADGVMIIDHGHARTNVCILARGRVVFARTLSRGGRHVTGAIARAWGMPLEEAERAKHSDGFIASSNEPAPTEAWARISDVVRVELVPLAREVRQTLAACRAQTGVAVARAVLAGGGARLRGLANFLMDELELPVGLVLPDDLQRMFGPTSARAAALPLDAGLLSVGVALEGASGRPAFDLRQGPLAYKHDFSFLRARAGYLVGAGLAVAAFFAGNAYAALYKLRAEQAILDKQLETETTEIFGAPVSLEEIESKIAPKREDSPLPKMTAFDILVDISKKLPPKSEGKLDVNELVIEPKRVFIKAVADSSATIDAVGKKLREIECFTDLQPGRVDTVSDGKQFTFTITAKCM